MTSLKLGRALARGAIGSALAVSMMGSTVLASDIDLSKWSPEYVRSIAGTETYDTVAGCNAVTPTDYKGRLTFWYQGIFEGDPQVMRDNYADFFKAFRAT